MKIKKKKRTVVTLERKKKFEVKHKAMKKIKMQKKKNLTKNLLNFKKLTRISKTFF